MDELEPLVESDTEKAARIVRELRAVADTIEDNPELAKLADPVEAAERMLDDLAALDALADLGKLDEM